MFHPSVKLKHNYQTKQNHPVMIERLKNIVKNEKIIANKNIFLRDSIRKSILKVSI